MSSLIEILSINENNNIIEYKCLNKNNNEHNKIMSIKEYLEQMSKYNNKNINIDYCSSHNNNKYMSFCFNCNKHLCKECIQSRIHLNHIKNNILEIQPFKEELDIIDAVIKDYKDKIEEMNIQKINKLKKLEKKLNENKIKEKKLIEEKIENNNNNEKNELKKNYNKYMEDILVIKKKYEEQIKDRKNKFELENNIIKNKYKLIKERENINYEYKIEQLIKKYNNTISNLKYDKILDNMNSIKKLNEIVFKIYNIHNDNYYNALNIKNILLSFAKSEYFKNIMKKVLNNNYEKTLDRIIKIRPKEFNSEINLKKNIDINEYENKIRELEKQLQELKGLKSDKIKQIIGTHGFNT